MTYIRISCLRSTVTLLHFSRPPSYTGSPTSRLPFPSSLCLFFFFSFSRGIEIWLGARLDFEFLPPPPRKPLASPPLFLKMLILVIIQFLTAMHSTFCLPSSAQFALCFLLLAHPTLPPLSILRPNILECNKILVVFPVILARLFFLFQYCDSPPLGSFSPGIPLALAASRNRPDLRIFRLCSALGVWLCFKPFPPVFHRFSCA